jgi:hypothetical protein
MMRMVLLLKLKCFVYTYLLAYKALTSERPLATSSSTKNATEEILSFALQILGREWSVAYTILEPESIVGTASCQTFIL